MTLNDLIIIYLTCGAPFGVYYFLQNRNLSDQKFLLLKIVFNFFFWIPFAISVILKSNLVGRLFDVKFGQKVVSDLAEQERILQIGKFFEQQLLALGLPLSIYEFRKISERYVGLTLELRNAPDKITNSEREFFRITNNENQKLAEICLHRRNRQRLIHHQTLARRDFWKIIQIIFENSPKRSTIFNELSILFQILDDNESLKTLKNFDDLSWQTSDNEYVSLWRNEVWNSDRQKQPQKQTFLAKNQFSTTMSLSSRD